MNSNSKCTYVHNTLSECKQCQNCFVFQRIESTESRMHAQYIPITCTSRMEHQIQLKPKAHQFRFCQSNQTRISKYLINNSPSSNHIRLFTFPYLHRMCFVHFIRSIHSEICWVFFRILCISMFLFKHFWLVI